MQQDALLYVDGMNLQEFVGSNPVNGVDPSGAYFESGWDLFSLGVGITALGLSLIHASATGEGWGDVALDAFGVGVDLAALALPGVPGGAGVAIQATRAGRATQQAYRALTVARRIETGINLYQGGQGVYQAGQDIANENYYSAGLRLLGAGLQFSHAGIRGAQWLRARQYNTVEGLLLSGRAPGAAGVTLTQRTVHFDDLWALTVLRNRNIEFNLTRELVNGRGVFRLYSGTRGSVYTPSGVRSIGHTHPPRGALEQAGALGLDEADVRVLFRFAQTRQDPNARVLSRLIAGYDAQTGLAIQRVFDQFRNTVRWIPGG